MTLSPIPRSSPNQEPRPDGVPVDILLVHYTGMPTGAEALERLCDPASRVSAHYLVDEDGTVFALVPEERRAWHAASASGSASATSTAARSAWSW